jgi:transporter family protein
MSWTVLALLSALFAGLTAILAKIGVSQIPSNLATLIRTFVVLGFAAAIVVARGEFDQVGSLTRRDWGALVLSGIATGLSWLCYFAAIKHGPISGVAPIDKLSFVIAMTLGFIVFSEPIKPLTLAGAGLIVTGVLLTIPSIQELLTK